MRHSGFGVSIVLFTLIATCSYASKVLAQGTPAQELASVQGEIDRLLARYERREREEKDFSARQWWQELRRDARPLLSKALDVAERHPQDTVALQACIWVITGKIPCPDQADRAFRVILDHHISWTRFAELPTNSIRMPRLRSSARFYKGTPLADYAPSRATA